VATWVSENIMKATQAKCVLSKAIQIESLAELRDGINRDEGRNKIPERSSRIVMFAFGYHLCARWSAGRNLLQKCFLCFISEPNMECKASAETFTGFFNELRR